eukprot:11171321-Lingulodinium_polyedra.AAC.1
MARAPGPARTPISSGPLSTPITRAPVVAAISRLGVAVCHLRVDVGRGARAGRGNVGRVAANGGDAAT